MGREQPEAKKVTHPTKQEIKEAINGIAMCGDESEVYRDTLAIAYEASERRESALREALKIAELKLHGEFCGGDCVTDADHLSKIPELKEPE